MRKLLSRNRSIYVLVSLTCIITAMIVGTDLVTSAGNFKTSAPPLRKHRSDSIVSGHIDETSIFVPIERPAMPFSPSVVCSGTNPVTCTGGAGASVVFPSPASAGTTTNHASTYPATLTVPVGNGAGQIPAGATVQSVTVQFNGLTAKNAAAGCTGCGSARDMGVVLQSPGGARSLQVMSRIGSVSASSISNFTVKIQDGGATLPVNPTGWTAGGTFAPASYDGTLRDGEVSPDYTPTGPASPSLAAPVGSATMASTFGGAAAPGTWNVYLADDGGRIGFGVGGADISFTSFDLVITYSGASTPSTTTLTPNLTSPFTAGANSSDVLTATVTAGATGTVTFKDAGTNLTCSGGNPAAISGSAATCSTTFSSEGLHALSAVYSGDSTFVTSTGTANIFAKNHATNVGTTYCNTGVITSTGASDAFFTATAPYPSVIFVGDGVNTDILNSVSTVSLQLKNVTSFGGVGMRLLLVSPDGRAFDFWDGPGAQPNGNVGNYIIQDGGAQPPQAPIAPGTYGPISINPTGLLFTPAPSSPAPQIPGTAVYPAPAGSATFATAFNGATAHGAWSLYYHNANGSGTSSAVNGGWCITISPASGHPTTTAVASSATPFAVFGASTSFTATVASAPTPGQGVVTFTENGAPLTGAPNGGVANVVGGVATIATSTLTEGDHTITASYYDGTNTFNDSFGTITIRVDKPTSTPTLSGSTWSYCNTGTVTIPLGTLGINDFGPASPNPSNITVANLPGRVSSFTLTMKGFHHVRPQNLQTLLVGPNGGSTPTAAQTFDFFSNAGAIVQTPASGTQDILFSDAFAATPPSSGPGTTTGPASYPGTTSYTASPFYTLPGTFQRATTAGAFTFSTGVKTGSSGGVYLNTDPIGLWSLYFDQTANAIGSGLAGGWCVNITPTAVTGTGTAAHVGPAPGNHMRQGGTGSVTFSLLNNGNGPTGDPDQAVSHAMTISGTLPSGLTLDTVPTGSPWNCTANTTTSFTCTNLAAIAQGSSYQLLTVPVNVAGNAPASAVISGVTFSGAGMTAGTFAADTVTIDPAAILAVTKSHTGTFANGHTAVWNLQVNNNSATAAGATDGSIVTVTDVLPAGYSLASFTGAGWSCTGTTTITCTSNAVVAGAGGAFNLIALTVNVPTNSPASVSNTATAFGGGDLVHTSSGTAVSSNTDTTAVTNTIVWNGSASTDWNAAANWTPAVIPNAGNNVSIPTGAIPNEPSVSTPPDGAITKLTVSAGRTLTVAIGRTLNSTGACQIDGSWNIFGGISCGSFTSAGTVSFNGSTVRAIPVFAYNNLVLDDTGGFTMPGSFTVNGQLTLTNGKVNTGANTLTIGTSGTVARTNGFVVGSLQKQFGGVGVFTYPVGTTGAFSPVDVSVTAGSGSLTILANTGIAPATPVLSPTATLKRYWTLTGSGITANVTWHYLAGDVGGNESQYSTIRVSGTTATFMQNGTPCPGVGTPCVDATAHTIFVGGLNSFSNWTAGVNVATAAGVGVSGRVMTADGRGVSNARVSISDGSGNDQFTLTNSSGYYRFLNVASGQSYVISVSDKRYNFTPRVISIADDLTGFDFVADPPAPGPYIPPKEWSSALFDPTDNYGCDPFRGSHPCRNR